MRQIQDSPSGYLSENYNYMKLLKRTAFSLLGILLLILTIATILEKIYGTDFVNEYIYSSVPFVILWGVTAITSLLYIIKSKLHRQPVIFLLHLSLLFILAGAFTTWIYGEQGTMRVRQGEQQTSFTDSKGISHQLPFSITLNQFEIIYYFCITNINYEETNVRISSSFALPSREVSQMLYALICRNIQKPAILVESRLFCFHS